MKIKEINIKLKKLEKAAKVLHPDNTVSIAITAQYRYLTNLKNQVNG